MTRRLICSSFLLTCPSITPIFDSNDLLTNDNYIAPFLKLVPFSNMGRIISLSSRKGFVPSFRAENPPLNRNSRTIPNVGRPELSREAPLENGIITPGACARGEIYILVSDNELKNKRKGEG